VCEVCICFLARLLRNARAEECAQKSSPVTLPFSRARKAHAGSNTVVQAIASWRASPKQSPAQSARPNLLLSSVSLPAPEYVRQRLDAVRLQDLTPIVLAPLCQIEPTLTPRSAEALLAD
jgi:hypothetical protein